MPYCRVRGLATCTKVWLCRRDFLASNDVDYSSFLDSVYWPRLCMLGIVWSPRSSFLPGRNQRLGPFRVPAPSRLRVWLLAPYRPGFTKNCQPAKSLICRHPASYSIVRQLAATVAEYDVGAAVHLISILRGHHASHMLAVSRTCLANIMGTKVAPYLPNLDLAKTCIGKVLSFAKGHQYPLLHAFTGTARPGGRSSQLILGLQ